MPTFERSIEIAASPAAPSGGTRVRFKYHMEARIRGGALGDWVLSRIFAREMESRLRALERAVEEQGVLGEGPAAAP